MVKKYTDNYRLDIAYATIFRNLEPIEEISIHTALNITSGYNLTKKDMVSGAHIVYGGGGETGNTHSEFNVDYKTLGIGRVGARCGCVFEIIPNSWVTDNALMIQSYDKRFSLDFLRHFLSYSDLGQYANNAMQPVISKTRIKEVTIPLIDIQEQNTLSKILDSIEKNEKFESNDYNLLKSKIKIIDNWETLNVEIEIQNDLTAQLKQSILQEAIQGKLTADWREQNPATKSAIELLKRVKEEKDQLIKDKKIKKEKALPPITGDEIPFELPEGWVWCRFGTLKDPYKAFSYGILKPDKPRSSGVKLIKSGDVGMFKVEQSITNIISEKLSEEYKRTVIEGGEILINLVGASIGRCGIVSKGLKGANVSRAVAVYKVHNTVSSSFIQYLLYGAIQLLIKGNLLDGSNRPVLNIGTMKQMVVALPPIEEQKAIVGKVETLMQRCQALEEEIKTSEANAQMLMQAVLKEAFESKKEEVEV